MSLEVSFEFFPPKTPELEESLWRSIRRLEPLSPSFVSVTYGAGGSTRERTHQTVKQILETTKLTPAAHLTCVGSSKEEVLSIAKEYWDLGVRHLVALRGDPPPNTTNFTPHPDGFTYATDLVRGLKEIGAFEISVAGFPEGHPESKNAEEDIAHLKSKIDAGATRIITQFFFDNALFLRFVERCRKAGITCPIVPGIMPVTNFTQTHKFALAAGATIPDWFSKQFEGLEQDAETRKLVSATLVAKQVEELVKNGVTNFHFYTLNRSDLTFAICHILGIRVPAS